MRLLIAPIFLLIYSLSYSQIDNRFFKGIKNFQSDEYSGKALYGYIDGGADIFMEYGFQKLNLYSFELNGIRYKIEIYKFNSPADAFGMLSFSCSEKLIQEKKGYFSYSSDYQYQINYGFRMISIISEDKADIKIKQNMMSKLLKSLTFNKFTLPDIYLKSEFTGLLKYIKGPLAIDNLIPMLTDKMNPRLMNFYYLYFESGTLTSSIFCFLTSGKESEIRELMKLIYPDKLVSLKIKKNLIFVQITKDEKELSEVSKKLFY